MKREFGNVFVIWMAMVFGLAGGRVQAQLPPDFPKVTVTTCDTNAVAGGDIFLTVTLGSTNTGTYVMVLKNDGTPVWYQRAPTSPMDFKLLPNGLLHYAQCARASLNSGSEAYHEILDNAYNLQETINLGNGYVADGHDIDALPNGNVLVLGYYQSQVDLSQMVPGGWPNAMVLGAVLQELDSQRNVVWQWRSWDHYPFVPGQTLLGNLVNPLIAGFHANTFNMDTDGNVLISNYPVDVEKINRQTGEVMWRIGGPMNQFTFVGENPQQAVAHFACHGVERLANGNILIFWDGDLSTQRSSMVYEYRLDEVNKVATPVWSYSPTPPIVTGFMGKAQRLPNGNTFIGWGGPSMGDTNHPIPACTEVTPSGRVVFQMNFNDPFVSTYRAFRFPYPPQSQGVTVVQSELMPGNTYNFGAAGASLTVTAGGGGYNSVFVKREPYAPIDPVFTGKPPRVLPSRVSMTETAISTMSADIDFDVATFGFANPTILTVYYRSSTGQGIFLPQPTSFNPVSGKLSISMDLQAQGTDFGEFVFGYPDVVEVPYPPILNAVENYRGVQVLNVVAPLAATTGAVYVVNQNLPVSLSWSPRGFAAYYQLQVSTNQDFSSPLVDLPSQSDAYYVLSNALPGTAYFYRVKTWNDGGEGSWAAGSFQTAPPFVQVTAPNHGEAWRRGVAYFVQWNGNLAENVKIDLYKSGSFLSSITTNTPSTGAFKWSIPFSLTPSSDYTIQITSVTNSSLTSVSAQPFSIVDAPVISGSQITRLPNGVLQFGFTAPGAAQATVWGTTLLSPPSWQKLGAVPVTNGSGTFTNTPPYLFYRVSLP